MAYSAFPPPPSLEPADMSPPMFDLSPDGATIDFDDQPNLFERLQQDQIEMTRIMAARVQQVNSLSTKLEAVVERLEQIQHQVVDQRRAIDQIVLFMKALQSRARAGNAKA